MLTAIIMSHLHISFALEINFHLMDCSVFHTPRCWPEFLVSI